MTATLEAAPATGPADVPTTANRTVRNCRAPAMTAAPSATPAPMTTSHCCTTSDATKVAAFASVCGPLTARYDTFARVARDALCMPAHAGAAAGSATPRAPVSRHARKFVYARTLGSLAGPPDPPHPAATPTAARTAATAKKRRIRPRTGTSSHSLPAYVNTTGGGPMRASKG
jgi:hypothetical protein